MRRDYIDGRVTVDEGMSPDGVITKLHYEGDNLITQKTYDAEPHLQYAADAREQTAGKRWGDGRLIGHIPPAEYARFLKITDNQERKKAILAWLRENNKFIMFDGFK